MNDFTAIVLVDAYLTNLPDGSYTITIYMVQSTKSVMVPPKKTSIL